MSILETIISKIQDGVDQIRGRATTKVIGPRTPAEVNAFLTEAAKSCPEATNYLGSAVDLMKVVDMDSSLEARKELAKELGYTGALDGSAAMNEWLHREVMAKVAGREIG